MKPITWMIRVTLGAFALVIFIVAAAAGGGSSATAGATTSGVVTGAVVGTGSPSPPVVTSDRPLFSWTPPGGLPTGGYAWGQCTWWMAMEGHSGGDHQVHWSGNAYQWYVTAAAAGYRTEPPSVAPEVGWIAVFNHGPGASREFGHVAVVVAAHGPAGAWTVSEANVLGLGVIDQRTFPWPPPAQPQLLGWIP